MRIAVIGTGSVGRTLARGFTRIGHDVVVGTRNPEETKARDEWAGSDVRLLPLAEVGKDADVVVNATNGAGSQAALQEVGADALAGKVIVDVSNPLDMSRGFPPSLFVVNTDSLAEQLQRAFPEARVVKTFNTVTAAVMVDPSLAGGDSTAFVAGNDPDARATVVGLAREFGWQDVMELGDLSAARAMEMYLPLWLRLFQAAGTPMVNVKVVHGG